MEITSWFFCGIAWICLAAWYIRAGHANDVTYRQRMQIIAAIDDAGWPGHLQRQYQRVDYQSHLRERFWGRDAISLYPIQLQEVIRSYRGDAA